MFRYLEQLKEKYYLYFTVENEINSIKFYHDLIDLLNNNYKFALAVKNSIEIYNKDGIMIDEWRV